MLLLWKLGEVAVYIILYHIAEATAIDVNTTIIHSEQVSDYRIGNDIRWGRGDLRGENSAGENAAPTGAAPRPTSDGNSEWSPGDFGIPCAGYRMCKQVARCMLRQYELQMYLIPIRVMGGYDGCIGMSPSQVT
ncbi:hypothetical protein IQ06DRAFT_365879 [Phaeosphaeriaceae sp. SRC1lsM3a]|nr:hypothetical protein IQ06DRAFT_365879 [Stagonospora sp. SRC1lsM3a]